MRAPVVIGAVTLAVVVFVATPRGYSQEAEKSRASMALLDSLDECIQGRFRDSRARFS